MLTYAHSSSVFHETLLGIRPIDPAGPVTQAPFVGTEENDDFEGTATADTFDLTQGGNDKADGKAGADVFTLDDALTKKDKLNGGADLDTLHLDNAYSSGVTFSATTLTNIEQVILHTTTASGGSFNFTLNAATVAANNFLQFAIEPVIGATTALEIDGSDVEDGTLVLIARGEASDTLIGGGGNDVLSPGSDGDFLEVIDGGGGINRVAFGSSNVGVNVSLAEQGAPQQIAGDWTVDMTNIQDLGGSANADLLTGDNDDNWLLGSGGNDVFVAGKGDDLVQINNIGTMTAVDADGGQGEDTLDFATALSGPVIFSLAKQGDPQDTNQGFTLDATNFENITGSLTQPDKLTGDGDANKLFGSGGNDKLKGGGGDDELYGDLEYGPVFGPGASRSGFGTFAHTGADTLTGGNGNDLLEGGNADDKLLGGAGIDTQNGGTGADTFIFKKDTESGVGNGNRDTLDFSQSDGDIIDLHKIDADTTDGGNQDFELGGSSFTDTAGELIQFTQGGKTIIAGDTDGDGDADFEIALTTNPTLDIDDFNF